MGMIPQDGEAFELPLKSNLGMFSELFKPYIQGELVVLSFLKLVNLQTDHLPINSYTYIFFRRFRKTFGEGNL